MANKKQPWDKKFDYHDYVYLRIPIEQWQKWEEKLKEGKDSKISFKTLKAYRISYEGKIEKKRESANNASKIRKARADMKIYKTLEGYFGGLFKDENIKITIYKLAKDSGVSFNKVKRFWQEHDLDYWIEQLKKDRTFLKEFLYKELSESVVWGR